MDGDQPPAGSSITIAFDEGQIKGYAICRDYSGTYEADIGQVRFPRPTMVQVDCSGPEASHLQEGDFTTILEWAKGCRHAGGQIEILTARGKVLVFARLGE